jgi:hypothetical protein
MIISDENRKFLYELSNEFKELIEKDNVDELLSTLDDFIVTDGMDEDYNQNSYGDKIDKVWHEIQSDNFDDM